MREEPPIPLPTSQEFSAMPDPREGPVLGDSVVVRQTSLRDGRERIRRATIVSVHVTLQFDDGEIITNHRWKFADAESGASGGSG